MINHSVNHPKTIVEVIKHGFQLWANTFMKAIPFSLLLGIINMGLQFGMKPYLPHQDGKLSGSTEGMHAVSTVPEMPGYIFLYLIAFMVFSLIIHAGMSYRINAIVLRTEPTFDKALLVGVRKVFPILGVWILTSLAMFVGFMALVIPGVVIGVYFAFSYLLVVITDKGIIESIRESCRLVSGNFWHTLGALVLIGLTYIVLAFALAFLLGLLAFVLEPVVKENLYIVMSSVVIVILYPFFTTCLLAVLYDLQNRKSLDSNQKPTHRIAA